jgi:hypothetical protein
VDAALESAALVVVFWCVHSAASEQVRLEYERAVALRKEILPVLIDSTPLPDVLREYQYIDFRTVVSAIHITEDEIPRVRLTTRTSDMVLPLILLTTLAIAKVLNLVLWQGVLAFFSILAVVLGYAVARGIMTPPTPIEQEREIDQLMEQPIAPGAGESEVLTRLLYAAVLTRLSPANAA